MSDRSTTGAPPAGARARQRYLAAGADLMTARPDGPPVQGGMARIRLRDVADEMGSSRTGLYKLWDTQEDFWRDLSLHLILEEDEGYGDDALPWFTALESSELDLSELSFDVPEDIAEVLRVLLNAVQDFVVDQPKVAFLGSLLGYHDLPEAKEVRARTLERRLQDLGEVIAGLHALSGQRPRPPTTTLDLAATAWALGDGFAVLGRLLPRIADVRVSIDSGRGPRPWGLLASALGDILYRQSEPGESVPLPKSAPPLSEQYRTLSARWSPAQLAALQAATRLFFAGISSSDAPARGTHEPVEVPAQISVASVARASGVSRRAIYDIWPSVTRLRLDLLALLLTADRRRIDQLLSHVRPEDPWPAATLATALARPPEPDRLPPAHASLAYLPELTHPAVRHVYEQQVGQTVAVVARHVDRIWPDRAQPASGPQAEDDLAVLLMSLIWGVGRMLRFLPDVLDRRRLRSDPGSAALVQAIDALIATRFGAPERAVEISVQLGRTRHRPAT